MAADELEDAREYFIVAIKQIDDALVVAIRFDEIQVRQIGDSGKGLLKHVINALGKSA